MLVLGVGGMLQINNLHYQPNKREKEMQIGANRSRRKEIIKRQKSMIWKTKIEKNQ